MSALMSNKGRKAVVFFGGALLVSGSLFAVACGTDNGNTDTSTLPTPDGSAKDGRATGSGDGSSTTDDGAVGDAGAPDCGDVPFLRNNTSDFFCAFKDRDAGDGGRLPSTCTNNETCCNPNKVGAAFPPSFCATGKGATGCAAQAVADNSNWSAGGTAWECGDKRNCPGANAVCCMETQPDAGTNKFNVGATNNTDWPKACGVQEGYKWGGTTCRTTSCTAGTETPMCSADADCPQGQKCVPFFVDPFKMYFGVCK